MSELGQSFPTNQDLDPARLRTAFGIFPSIRLASRRSEGPISPITSACCRGSRVWRQTCWVSGETKRL